MLAWECLQKASKYLIQQKKAFIFPESFVIDRMYTPSYNTMGGFGLPLGVKQEDVMQLTLRIDHNYTVKCYIPEDDFNLSKPNAVDLVIDLNRFETDDDKQVARIMYILWAIYKEVVERRIPDPLLAISPDFIHRRINEITRTM